MKNRKRIVMAALCVSLAAVSPVRHFAHGQSEGSGAPKLSIAPSPAAANGKAAAREAAIASIDTASGQAAVTPRTSNTPEELAALTRMEQVSETDSLALFINRETAAIAVKDKRDGYIWFSNPVDAGSDKLASPLYRSEMSSQLLLNYYNDKGQVYRFNSFDDSVQKKQFAINVKDGAVNVTYQFGKAAGNTDIIPAVIGKQRFEDAILAKLKDDDARKQVTYKYRYNEEKQVYTVRNLQDNVKQELADYLTSAGYTAKDAAKDNKENGGSSEEAAEAEAQFTIPVEYALDGDQFVVTIHGKDVKYNEAFPLASVQVLKHFGAADDKKDGYIFVPDGSGALIRLNNKKLTAEPYRMPVYGEDGTFDVKERVLTSTPVRLPVFGMKQNDHAVLGIIEGGDALASILADISGRHDAYNSVNAEFQFVAQDVYTLTSGTKSSSVPMFQKHPYQGDIKLRYAFLSGDDADYVGMAGAYREYLIAKYDLKKLTSAENAPFILELEGAFKRQKSFLGIPYKTTEPLTTFEDAARIIAMLKERGVDDLALRYVGWFNGGIRHGSPKSIKPESALGGKSGLNKLANYAEENGVRLYPDTAFLEKYKGSQDSADFLDRRNAAIYKYDPVMFVKDSASFSHYVLSANKLPGTVGGFLSDYGKLGIHGLSLRDMGSEVNSDFNPSSPVSRQDALGTIVAEAGKLKQGTESLMVSGGNAYMVPYADIIVGAPTSSNRKNITDEDVMFYQIALHGYVDLAGAPFNREDTTSPRASMLKALETGSNLYYVWYYKDSSAVKDTAYNDLYALHYADWIDEATALYQEMNPVLKQVRNETIVGHRNLADGVVETTFENGLSILINYNTTAVQVNGMSIGAESFRLGGE
ncbi:hypothetical protein GZH47_25095 [Paenibacillus rhizovicinus]|uniref:DUF5057 domain-containing protein n=1 Tax=Paenibacillus rhizovicinus TaxID=2704463 RepID=A0A6C0PB07_9BACL|nr:DUF5696 domain-containing protein [Paenibacillus rhizovicinus]QHW33752.1 hypothetical protein GZH47_25095 [Paenibacillus rhizovicinus]